MLTESSGKADVRIRLTVQQNKSTMCINLTSFMKASVVALGLAVFAVAGAPASHAQTPDAKTDQQKAQDAAKDSQKKIDEIAEAARTLKGPAANAECVWLGRRVVSLLWRDDLDTAFRHLDLYDRFGCPGGHIQTAFRCVVKQGPIDPKAQDSLNSRVHTCWLNPESAPAAAVEQTPAAEAPPATR